MLSPLLYSLFTHDCTARHNSNTIIKFDDDTTVVGLITNNDETAYREEARDLSGCCQNNNLSLNTGAPQGCVLSPLLYSLFTHDCTARHNSNPIIKFADDTTVVA